MEESVEVTSSIVINGEFREENDAVESRPIIDDLRQMEADREKENKGTINVEESESIASQDGNKYSSGFFTDKKGNLRFVNLVVRYPCLIFFLILASTIVISFLLVKIVFDTGNPFSEPGSEYDIHDIRSTAYDSFRLAQEEVENQRAVVKMATNEKEIKIQEDYLDATYWVYESETKNGLFSSPESISAMKESLDLFTNHNDYESYCWKFYIDIPFTGSKISQCRPLLSALNMYYASYWDAVKAQSVIDEIGNPKNVDIYNELSLCLEYDSYCELVAEELLTDENKGWFEALNNNITSILLKFDGKGELNDNYINQMTLFAAHLLTLNTKRGIVDFFYDKNFSVDNPVSMYSRAMINWGGPLNITGAKSNNNNETNQDTLKR